MSHMPRLVRTMCPMNCHPTLCGRLVEIEDGRLLGVRGDPDNPDSRGFLCIRGQASREIIGNPRRLLHPLVRARRGEDAWRRAEWAEVLDRIVEGMRAVGREAVGTWSGHGLFANNYGTRIASHLLRRFSNLYGCQWWNPTMICWGLGAWGLGLTGALETNTKEDMGAHANLILLWGANLASQPNTARYVAATTRPAMIVLGGSSMHKGANGWTGGRAIGCLPALTGNLGIPGGGFGPRHGSAVHGQGLASIVAEERRPPGRYVPNQMVRITEALLDGRVRALLLFGTDMLSSYADAGRVAEGLERADLVVSYDLFMNDTARRFADVVLPATAWLEELGCKSTNTHLYLMPKVLEPPGETRPVAWVLKALASRLGVDDFYPWESDEGPINAILDHPATGHATVAALRAEDGIRALRISHVAYPDRKFHTPSGKVEFSSDRARSFGLPALPVYVEPPASPYPLAFRQGRTLTQFHGFYDHGRALPTLANADPEPYLCIAPADPAARAIADGAAIKIHNERGEFHARARG